MLLPQQKVLTPMKSRQGDNFLFGEVKHDHSDELGDLFFELSKVLAPN